jgi:hypothetical protein
MSPARVPALILSGFPEWRFLKFLLMNGQVQNPWFLAPSCSGLRIFWPVSSRLPSYLTGPGLVSNFQRELTPGNGNNKGKPLLKGRNPHQDPG